MSARVYWMQESNFIHQQKTFRCYYLIVFSDKNHNNCAAHFAIYATRTSCQLHGWWRTDILRHRRITWLCIYKISNQPLSLLLSEITNKSDCRPHLGRFNKNEWERATWLSLHNHLMYLGQCLAGTFLFYSLFIILFFIPFFNTHHSPKVSSTTYFFLNFHRQRVWTTTRMRSPNPRNFETFGGESTHRTYDGCLARMDLCILVFYYYLRRNDFVYRGFLQ